MGTKACGTENSSAEAEEVWARVELPSAWRPEPAAAPAANIKAVRRLGVFIQASCRGLLVRYNPPRKACHPCERGGRCRRARRSANRESAARERASPAVWQ